MSIETPQTHEQIVAAFAQQEHENTDYWIAFDTEAFFRPIGTSWSPAQTMRHLSKSTRPVAKALAMPKLALRMMFKKPDHPSMTYLELVERYRGALANGGKAGDFAPSDRNEDDHSTWRLTIMREFKQASDDLRKAIARWRENNLDLYQLPHPLLGKLTVREMLFFTLYHQRHHIAVVQRRLSE